MKLTRAENYEANPFRAQLPPEAEQLGLPVVEFLQEVLSTLREQHSATQSGDSTVPWEQLTEIDDSQEFSLGSLGRFLHPDYGIITARYVEFVGAGITSNEFDFGLIAGYSLSETDHQWAVTTEFSESNRLSAAGFVAGYVRPEVGQFGWIIVSGTNLHSIRVYGEVAPTIGQQLVWRDNKQVEVSNTGTAVGVVDSIQGVKKSGILEWELPPATIRVEIFRQPAAFAEPDQITDEDILNIANRVGLMLDLTALRQLVTELQTSVNNLSQQLGDEITTRTNITNSLQNQLNVEHSTNLSQNDTLNQHQTTLDQHTTQISDHDTLITQLLARKVQVITDNNEERIASAVDHLKYIRFTNIDDVIYKFNRNNDLAIDSVITIRDVSTHSLTITTDDPSDVTINAPFFGTLESAGNGATIQIVKVGVNEYDVFGHVRTP